LIQHRLAVPSMERPGVFGVALSEIINTNLSSRPERSGVEGSAFLWVAQDQRAEDIRVKIFRRSASISDAVGNFGIAS
jgi:hypothetical protein